MQQKLYSFPLTEKKYTDFKSWHDQSIYAMFCFLKKQDMQKNNNIVNNIPYTSIFLGVQVAKNNAHVKHWSVSKRINSLEGEMKVEARSIVYEVI